MKPTAKPFKKVCFLIFLGHLMSKLFQYCGQPAHIKSSKLRILRHFDALNS